MDRRSLLKLTSIAFAGANETKGVRERTAICDKPKGKQSFN